MKKRKVKAWAVLSKILWTVDPQGWEFVRVELKRDKANDWMHGNIPRKIKYRIAPCTITYEVDE